ncbi:MAG: RsmB/NOP family class I SAM-dependent RNA methyltransferase [Pseudomonadota bacterium]
MRPDARAAAAIDILDRWLTGVAPAERLLAEWGRANRYAGSGDRRAIGDLVYDAIRRRRSALWVSGAVSEDGRALILGRTVLEGVDPTEIFTGARHAPAALDARDRLRDLSDAPLAVRHDLPDWLEPYMAALPESTLSALGHRAPLDLRVNLLKATVPGAVARLVEEGVQAEAGPQSPPCLRVRDGAHRVARTGAYEDGWVELQDASSQAVADLAAALPGETVLDFCAGGGGKTLALAAAMQNRGRLFAYDAAPQRLAQIAPRAARAGARITCLDDAGLQDLAGSCDLVFVDAPCSGTGAWRRTPEAKWALTPSRLDELTALQANILMQARRFLRPGGRMIYATCSLLNLENEARIDAFLEQHPHFRPGESLSLTDLAQGDGFFAQVLRNA